MAPEAQSRRFPIVQAGSWTGEGMRAPIYFSRSLDSIDVDVAGCGVAA